MSKHEMTAAPDAGDEGVARINPNPVGRIQGHDIDLSPARVEELLAELDRSPQSRGGTYLREYLSGRRLTSRQSIIAKCADCSCYYADGRGDCKVPTCPLYPYMPYREGRKNNRRRKHAAAKQEDA